MVPAFIVKSVLWSRSFERRIARFSFQTSDPLSESGAWILQASAFRIYVCCSVGLACAGSSVGVPTGWEPPPTSRAFDTASKSREGWRWLPASLGPSRFWVGFLPSLRFRPRRRSAWSMEELCSGGGVSHWGGPTPLYPTCTGTTGVADSLCASLVLLAASLREVPGLVAAQPDLLTCCLSIDALREVPGLADIVGSRGFGLGPVAACFYILLPD